MEPVQSKGSEGPLRHSHGRPRSYPRPAGVGHDPVGQLGLGAGQHDRAQADLPDDTIARIGDRPASVALSECLRVVSHGGSGSVLRGGVTLSRWSVSGGTRRT